ncbi:DUF4871 domain-containing protein [Bacillus solimangrovi]|uniref:DUF4871 domain-containing protein n=1 Tax=Bacillus solimangrovi TaxID=1305675 RepID=A0A1E5LAB2_9BACI|nr:DUF4871 domain-containing protein [Bacillus solimangrovi]OEH91047.1 hypothetical protein BFG57_06655 [Bacillus solimangrovi]
MPRELTTLVILLFISSILIACNENTVATNENMEDWKESPIFESDNYTMIGEQERLAFIYGDETVKFLPNKVNKYMWHFWGTEEEFNGSLTVIATHEVSNEQVTVVEDQILGGPNNGADKHVPSIMSLPKSGMWKLDAYIGENLFGSVFVKVHNE